MNRMYVSDFETLRYVKLKYSNTNYMRNMTYKNVRALGTYNIPIQTMCGI